MPEEDEAAEQEIIDEVEKTMNHYESQADIDIDKVDEPTQEE